MSTRVLLVGDADQLGVLSQTLGRVPSVQVSRVGAFDVALAEAERCRPQVVMVSRLLEPPFDGLQLARALRWSDPTVAVVLVAERPDLFLAEQALLVGAAGVIGSSVGARGLAAAVLDAVRGRLVLDDDLRDGLTLEVEGEPGPEDGRLLALLASGRRTVADLAEALGRSWHQVEAQLRDLEQRLGLVGRASLLLYADELHRAAEASHPTG